MPDTEHGEHVVTIAAPLAHGVQGTVSAVVYRNDRGRYAAVVTDTATGASITLDDGMLTALEIHTGQRARRQASRRVAGD